MLIGGPLEFNPNLLSSEPLPDISLQMGYDKKNIYWARSGRSAISLVLQTFREELSEGWLLLPDYQCWAVNSVFSSVKTKNISVTRKLILEDNALESSLKDPELKGVFLIDYFGLSNIESDISLIKNKRPDILVFVDAAQAFLSIVMNSEKYACADAIISSPRKFLPIPDGGLAIFPKQKIKSLDKAADNVAQQQNALFLSASSMRTARRSFQDDDPLIKDFESIYLKNFKEHNELFNNEINPISAFSFEVVKRIDLHALAKHRVKNFNFLKDSLISKKLDIVKPIFCDDSSPALVFPVRIKERKRDILRAYLQSKGIYCPVHWPMPEGKEFNLGLESKVLSGEILGFPIDQNCNTSTISILLEEIHNFSKLS